jgi:flagellar protein FlgJ
MEASSLIGQDSTITGLQQQSAMQASALQGSKSGDQKKVREAAEKFEAFFIGQMMEHMQAGIEADPLFGGGSAEEMWKSMLNQEYGKEIAKSGRLGIADQVMKGMLKMQEERNGTAQVAPAPEAAAEVSPEQAQNDAAIALVAAARLPRR